MSIKSVRIVFDNQTLDFERYSQVSEYTSGLLQIRIGESWALIKNTGMCWEGRSSGLAQEFVAIDSISVFCDCYSYSELYPSDSSVPGQVVVFSSGSVHPATGRSGLDGSDTFFCSIKPAQDFNVAVSRQQLAQSLIGTEFNLLQPVLDLYDFVDGHDFGNRMIPQNFVNRYKSIPISSVSGWYACFDIQSAGEGFTNCHYAHDAWFMAKGLQGSSAAHFIGYWLLISKICYGYISPGPRWFQGMYRFEKGSVNSVPTRRGYSQNPSPAKEWDIGLLVGAILYKENPLHFLILETVDKRRGTLLNRPPEHVWNGSGGARNLGRYLSNLMDFKTYDELMGLSNSDLYFSKANKVIEHAFKVNGSLPYFKNLQDGTISLWEEMTAFSMILRWIHKDGLENNNRYGMNKWLAQVRKMIEFYHSKAISIIKSDKFGDLHHCNYIFNQKTGAIEGRPHPLHNIWWLGVYAQMIFNGISAPLNGKDIHELALACLKTCTEHLGQNWVEILRGDAPLAKISVDNTPYGLSGEKQWGIALDGLRYARL